jgi:hypothetical protein
VDRPPTQETRFERQMGRLGTILGALLLGALVLGATALSEGGSGDGTIDGDAFLAGVHCERVAFVTELGGAFGRTGAPEGDVVRYQLSPRRSPRHPRARGADTFTDCTFPSTR